MAKVSILVPVYNVEQFFECCLRSLFEQTLDDIEYVFVNDCTPDGSMELLARVLNEYPHRKSQVKIINHSQNGGLAAARNTAIEAATGEYTIHIDSDDWVETTMCEKLYNCAQTSEADIVVCDYFMDSPGRRVYRSQSSVPSAGDELARALMREDLSWSLWNKLVRRNLYTDHGIFPIPGIDMGEDMMIMVKLASVAGRISYLPDAFLHYRQDNPNSLVARFSPKSVTDLLAGMAELERYFYGRREYANDIVWLKLRTRAMLLIHTRGPEQRRIAAMWPDIPRRYTLTHPRNMGGASLCAHWFGSFGWLWATHTIFATSQIVRRMVHG